LRRGRPTGERKTFWYSRLRVYWNIFGESEEIEKRRSEEVRQDGAEVVMTLRKLKSLLYIAIGTHVHTEIVLASFTPDKKSKTTGAVHSNPLS
jgi:hypothetical protein